MIDDPIVEETRKQRDEYASQFDYDINAMVRDLQERERVSGRQYTTLAPRPPEKNASHTA
jgi:hypothetical protein